MMKIEEDLMVCKHSTTVMDRIIIFQCERSGDGYWKLVKNSDGVVCYCAVPGSIVVVNNDDFDNPIIALTGRTYFEYEQTVGTSLSNRSIAILKMYPKLHLV